MSRHNKFFQHICFWSVLLLAVTAEGWMDLLYRAVSHI